MSNRTRSTRHGMKNIKSRTPHSKVDKTNAHIAQQERQDAIAKAIKDFEAIVA